MATFAWLLEYFSSFCSWRFRSRFWNRSCRAVCRWFLFLCRPAHTREIQASWNPCFWVYSAIRCRWARSRFSFPGTCRWSAPGSRSGNGRWSGLPCWGRPALRPVSMKVSNYRLLQHRSFLYFRTCSENQKIKLAFYYPLSYTVKVDKICASSSTDRVPDYESVGWRFESSLTHQEPRNRNGFGVLSFLRLLLTEYQ